MTHYRFYCVGGDGKIEAAEWVEASADEDAIMIARARRPTSTTELWEQGRLVARLGPKTPIAPVGPAASP